MRVIVTILMVLGLSGFSWAEYTEGVEYQVLKNIQPAPSDGKIEVIEFFSYGCPHCYRFEPYIEKWLKTKPDNIKFIRVPAVFNKNWEAFAALYYAAEALGVEEKMHPAIFKAMHGDGKKIRSMDGLKALFEKNGVTPEELDKAMNSFSVATKTRQAKTMTNDYQINSVPNVIVQGKYMTNGTIAKAHANVFGVVDFLAEKIKKDAKK